MRSARPVSARWTGWVRPPLAGRYRFHLATPRARVSLSREVVVEDGVSTGDGIELAVGKYYPIAISIDNLSPSFTGARLEWTAPYGARYVVPQALLNLPTETVSRPS